MVRTRKSSVRLPRSCAASDLPSHTRARESSTLVNRSAAKLERRERWELSNAEDGQTKVARSAAYAPSLQTQKEGDWQCGASSPGCIPFDQAHLCAARG